MRIIKIIIIVIFIFANNTLFAQDTIKAIIPDTTRIVNFDSLAVANDTVIKQKHDPHKATLRSAIVPGWGQAYNHEYWKIPIVYAALSIPVVTFLYNNKWYKKTRDAYNIVVNEETNRYDEIDPKLKNASGEVLDASSLQYYRNQFRRDKDYSVLYFLIIWGVNVVDATVFAHLKDFDVTDELSMHIQPDYNLITKTANMGIAFNFKASQRKLRTVF